MVNPCKNKLLALHLQSISFGEERIATLAQLVEQRIRNAQVEGSNPLSGSKKIRRKDFRLIFLLHMRKKKSVKLCGGLSRIDWGSGGKTLCIMPSSTTECGKLEPISGIARGELRSTWAERAFAEVGVVSGRENFRRNCRCRRDYPRCEHYRGYQEIRHR